MAQPTALTLPVELPDGYYTFQIEMTEGETAMLPEGITIQGRNGCLLPLKWARP
ncbi:MAG: hypothetical protein HC804_06960 [Anaerolineae bacterium]|nr:hypothetical protein [Anaerolineae bacterium]